MKILYVGDMHVVPEDIEECQRLLDFVFEFAKEQQAQVVFLGDQHHTHSIVRIEVMRFWYENFKRFQTLKKKTIALVGNHDLSHSLHPQEHSMVPYKDLIQVVDSLFWDETTRILYAPYYASSEKFLEEVTKFKQQNPEYHTLVCHQTFSGAQYENGFYAKESIELDQVPYSQIISGHIHSTNQIGKLLYVGSPRWKTFADANIDKSLFLIDHAEDGSIQHITKISTAPFCKKIVVVSEKELESLENALS